MLSTIENLENAHPISKKADMAGAMISIMLTPRTAEKLAVIGGEPPERLHITLAYLGKAADLPRGAEAKIASILLALGEEQPRLYAKLTGYGRFTNTNPDEDAAIALVDCVGLSELRYELLDRLEAAGIPFSKEHGFTPHVTVAYIGRHEQLPKFRSADNEAPVRFRISRVSFVAGENTVFSATLRGVRKSSITGADLESGGKLNPATPGTVDKVVVERDGKWCVLGHEDQQNFGCYDTKAEAEERLRQVHTFKGMSTSMYDINIQFPIVKMESSDEERYVLGIVLEPEEVDLQDDIIDAEGIRRTAHRFLSNFNLETELGWMHQILGDIGVELVESYIAPIDFTIGDESVKKGSWLIATRVLDDKTWADVKSGKLTGFSVAGMAMVADS